MAAAALGNEAEGKQQHDNRQRKVDQECVAPRPVFDHEAANDRPQRRGNCGPAGPGADCLAPDIFLERRTDQGQAARHQQGAADTLNRPGPDQLLNAADQAAPGRSDCEQYHAEREDAAPAEAVAGAAAGQQQCRQEQRIRLDHPLHLRRRRPELALQRRQRHVGDGTVDEDHARRQYRCRQNPGAGCGAARRVGRAAPNRALVASGRSGNTHLISPLGNGHQLR